MRVGGEGKGGTVETREGERGERRWGEERKGREEGDTPHRK